jgi:hypothetical protein
MRAVPYQEDLINVYLIDSEADAFGAYTYLSDPSFPMINKQGSNYCVEWGTVNHKDGSSCLHAPPNAQMIVLHNNSDIEILTEDAPKWGDPDPNIPGNGCYFQLSCHRTAGHRQGTNSDTALKWGCTHRYTIDRGRTSSCASQCCDYF